MSTPFRIVTLLVTLAVIVLGGTVFFRWAEGWSWLDAYFFTVVTLSTVGYGNLVPVTALGKIGTTVFILVGLGVFAVAVQQFGMFAMRKREEHTEWLIARFGHPEASANTDADPSDPPITRDKP
jgi:voltage-gated potassium channel